MIHEIEQRSTEWHQLRLGKFTASGFYKLFSKKDSSTYKNYINDIVIERLTGQPVESYVNEAMQRGIDLEPEAIIEYEFITDRFVEQVGFVQYNDFVGVSPDGLVNDKGLIEIKCPRHTTFIEQHLSGKVPTQYYWQMQGQMWVTGRKWCDYFVYYPNLKPFIRRVERNNKDIIRLMREIVLAKNEVLRRVESLL